MVTGDFDGDRKRDLAAVSTFDGSLTLFDGKGDGTFAAPKILTLGGVLFSIEAGQFDADRRVELAITQRDTPTLTLLRNTGCEPPFTLADVHRWPWPWRCWLGAE